jgi:hypothetical protein
MTRPAQILAALAAAFLAGPAPGADFSDPSWPCIQRKVETLSVGLMWPEPLDEAPLADDLAADVSDLAQRFALRRLALEEVRPALDAFVAKHGADRALLGHVFAGAFDRLAGTRRQIMAGIEEYSLSQIDLAARIEAARDEMDTLMQADEPDYDRVDALEEQIDWDERIYNERRQSLTYVCETPVLIEKRLYETAQMLQSAANEG